MAATVLVYHDGLIRGTVTNDDGVFSISLSPGVDSIRISMVGYHSATWDRAVNGSLTELVIQLAKYLTPLYDVIVRPMSATEIMTKSAEKVSTSFSSRDYETSGFYREIIKDHEHYFSVAEAIFKAQFFPAKKNYRLMLERGRVKEDVTYTALFEDFHPGGGPQLAVNNGFVTAVPAFLKTKEFPKFEFRKEHSTIYDNRHVYEIAFDQKQGVKESLEKGRVFVDAEDQRLSLLQE